MKYYSVKNFGLAENFLFKQLILVFTLFYPVIVNLTCKLKNVKSELESKQIIY